MQNRREFLKTAAFAALGSGMAINVINHCIYISRNDRRH